VTQIDREFNEAMGGNDAAALDRIFADDCIFTNERGMVFGKAHRVDVTKSGRVTFDSYSAEDVKVSMYGGAAVVIEGGTTKGSDQHHTGKFRYTRVYVKQDGRWQLVAAHKSNVADQQVPTKTMGQASLASSSAGAVQGDAVETDPRSPAEREVLKTEHQRVEALIRKDMSSLEQFYHPDFVSTSRNGQVTDRMQYLEGIRSAGTKIESMEHSDVRVRVYGETAVVTGRTSGKGRISGIDFTDKPGRFTHVYFKRDGRWQIVAMQNSPSDARAVADVR
jgi:ketosteroid isomerase-like protein